MEGWKRWLLTGGQPQFAGSCRPAPVLHVCSLCNSVLPGASPRGTGQGCPCWAVFGDGAWWLPWCRWWGRLVRPGWCATAAFTETVPADGFAGGHWLLRGKELPFPGLAWRVEMAKLCHKTQEK